MSHLLFPQKAETEAHILCYEFIRKYHRTAEVREKGSDTGQNQNRTEMLMSYQV